MLQPLLSTGFVKQPRFKFKAVSVLLFIGAAAIAWEANILAQTFFPSQNSVPYFARTGIMFATDLGLIYVSFLLLKQNGLPAKALGLSLSGKMITDILCGVFIAAIATAIIMGMLFMSIPYHFVRGTIGSSQVVKESINYLSGNSLEELMFRGFLFILFSQLTNWRISILIMAIPFGLFHLQGIGFNIHGLKMFATTGCYSFVFSLSYVLFRSMWTSISVHVLSNIFLHTLTGLDGANRAVFTPVFEKSWPVGHDVSFNVMIYSALIISSLLFLLTMLFDKRRKALFSLQTNSDKSEKLS